MQLKQFLFCAVCAIIMLLSVGCRKDNTTDPNQNPNPNPTTKYPNVFYYYRDGVKCDVSKSAFMDSRDLFGGYFSNDSATIIITYGCCDFIANPNSASGFPKKGRLTSYSNYRIKARYNDEYTPVSDSVNQLIIDTVSYKNGGVDYIKGSFKANYIGSGPPVFLKGGFEFKNN